jgi:NADH-quinone oxidoreductase subunit F
VYETLKKRIESDCIPALLRITGCAGMCYREVLLEVETDGGPRVTYGDVTPEKAIRILEEHVAGGKAIEEWIVLSSDGRGSESDFFEKQKHIVLRNCGRIDPESIDSYLAAGGYKALEKVLKEMTPGEVIEAVTASGLRGRGGAGFPTGRKWRLAREASGEPRYFICNADEGDPGAFMDRSVLEGDPHSVLEGMLIGAYATGATMGYIYCRAEYPLAILRLKKAIQQSRQRGFLGKNVMGTAFSMELKIKEGAGAFVCGEETALIASIEGRRGMPRLRPPYPATSGLWGNPTNINNVETLANIPWIIINGPEKLAASGTAGSKGTKVFALAGKIRRGGLVEVPMGISLREIVFDVGGGTSSGKPFKAVQIGGPSGGCLPAALAETMVDYEEVNATGAIMGSGGLVVMDESTCMVDIARFFLDFTRRESCGKCTFCRIGTTRMLEILERITQGNGREGDIELLEDLGRRVGGTSLCALGQTAPNPVLTTIRYFRGEYEAHIREKRCPAGACKSLITFSISGERCRACGACMSSCSAGAISGELKKSFLIDSQKCVRCGICLESCKFAAIEVN